MNDVFLDDVNSLLDGDFGDDRILKQIARACKNNEVISNYERNYVQKLAEEYLGKKPKIIHFEKPETKIIPDIVIPKIESTYPHQIFQSQSFHSSKFNLKNSKLFLGFGGIAVVIIIGIIVLSNNTNSIPSNHESNIILALSVETDLSSYAQKDLISISGVSPNSEVVNLSIINQNGQLAWAEQVSVKNDGTYSTLAIAGGPGWENSGRYTIEVNDGLKTKSFMFSFSS